MKKRSNVAYFCMEYGLESEFKIYSGGLGILAGDHMKGAGDENLPIVGIGLLWKQGYTDQTVNDDGEVIDSYKSREYNDLEDTGIIVNVKIRERNVKCKVWKYSKNSADIYFLDTYVSGNDGADKWITGQLYGWFGEERIAQEMVLGIGGVRALHALGLEIDCYHFNEGHALFAGFELLREKMFDGSSFKEAVELTREEIAFTTHTPILQGNESHPIERLIYMGANCGLSIKQLTELGGSPFNMTVGGLRLSKIANGVAQLHGKTANDMWAHVDDRSEILAITNAIHKPTWVDEKMEAAAVSGKGVWEQHIINKQNLIDFVKNRTGQKLDVDQLVIGFSRRAAPYKRSDFIFGDKTLIEPLLSKQKVQIIFSGKAHPLDEKGKQIVSSLVAMQRKYPQSVVFLENYDMEIGAMLTRGADIWLNNPRRPKEASGTSGMKAAMNGVLNFSTLDGWWPEMCDHGKNGWQFGDGFVSDDVEAHDKHDLKALYKVLLGEVLPTFYDNRDKWVDMMIKSILDSKDKFAVKRMLDEYWELMYDVR